MFGLLQEKVYTKVALYSLCFSNILFKKVISLSLYLILSLNDFIFKTVRRRYYLPKHNKKSMKNTLQKWFILYTVFPMFLFVLLFSVFFFSTSEIETKEKTASFAANIAEDLDNHLAADQKFLKDLSTISITQSLFNEENFSKINLYSLFYQFNSQQENSTVLHIIDTAGNSAFSSEAFSPESKVYFTHFVFPRLAASTSSSEESNQSIFLSQKKSFYFLCEPLLEDGIQKGWAILFLLEEEFKNFITVPGNDISMVVDAFDRAVLSTTPRSINRYGRSAFIEKNSSSAELLEKNYSFSSLPLQNANLTIYTFNPKENSQILLPYLIGFTLIIAVVFFVSIQILARRLSSRLTSSIDPLLTGVQHTQAGDFSYHIGLETDDEFKLLAEQYNKMVDMIGQLLKDKENLIELKRPAEFKNLESQFHPHFLFNTLETLKYALLLESDIAPKILNSLIRFLKYQAYGTEQEVSLEEELGVAKEYMALHEYRFGNRFHFTISVDDSCKKIKIPKWTIQPILEISIKYGYQKIRAKYFYRSPRKR